MSKNNKKIGFDDLNGTLKTLVVLGWIYTALFAVFFMIGFMEGIMGVY
jgi:hypothetical protein